MYVHTEMRAGKYIHPAYSHSQTTLQGMADHPMIKAQQLQWLTRFMLGSVMLILSMGINSASGESL
jgi:hypothetical protein